MISQYVSEVTFCRTSRSLGDSSSGPRGSLSLYSGGRHHRPHLETRKENTEKVSVIVHWTFTQVTVTIGCPITTLFFKIGRINLKAVLRCTYEIIFNSIFVKILVFS